MASTSSLQETAQSLARLLPTLGVLVTEPLPEELRDSRSQMILMQILSRRQVATMSELATAMGIAVPTVSAMIRKMVQKGLLDRGHDPDDWRSVRLSLSPRGHQVLAEMTGRRTQAVTALLDGLSEPELATLNEAVSILHRLVQTKP